MMTDEHGEVAVVERCCGASMELVPSSCMVVWWMNLGEVASRWTLQVASHFWILTRGWKRHVIVIRSCSLCFILDLLFSNMVRCRCCCWVARVSGSMCSEFERVW